MEASDRSVLITADGSRTLKDSDKESFKSERGALTEARAVYLEGSRVGERLRSGEATRVLEVGFGAGLNFLASGSLALSTGVRLDYHALELDLPSATTMASLGYAELFAPSPLPEALLAWRAGLGQLPTAGAHRFSYEGVRLNLHLGDAVIGTWRAELTAPVDAIYHDAFSPHINPALWDERFLRLLTAQLAPEGRLVSFSVAGAVRRGLTAAGLAVERVPGPPGGKRQVMVAQHATKGGA